jgi:hypothetical protein
MPIPPGPRDERSAVLRAVHDGALGEDAAIERLERSPHGVWTAMDPASPLLVVIDGGARTVALAQRVVQPVAQRCAPDGLPRVLSDGFREDRPAILGPDIPQTLDGMCVMFGVGRIAAGEAITWNNPPAVSAWSSLAWSRAWLTNVALGDVVAQATPPNPARRARTVGEAVHALVLTGLGWLNPALDRGPRFCHHQPTDRLMAPRGAPAPRQEDALGRALDPRSASGVTARDRRRAPTAAPRRGRAPRGAPRDRTSVPVDGRYHRAQAPAAEVRPIPRGASRDPRPARHPGRREVLVEPQAGRPLLRPPRRGQSRAGHEGGQVLPEPRAQGQTTDGLPALVADRAVASANHRPPCAAPKRPWLTRGPAPRQAAPQARAPVDPPDLAPRLAGERSRGWSSHKGGVAQRWGRCASAPRQAQAQRPGDPHRLTPSAQAVPACPPRCRMTGACEAEARQALAPVGRGVQVTVRHNVAVHPRRREGPRGRPGSAAPPAPVVSTRTGALASALAARQALVDPHRGFLLATKARDEAPRSPPAVLPGDHGQAQAERGCRWLQDPQCFAASRSLPTPARLRAFEGAAGRFACRCGLRGPPASGPPHASGHGAAPHRPTGPAPHGTLGVPVRGRDAPAMPSWAVAPGAQAARGAPASAPTPGETGGKMVSRIIHPKARGTAKCRP